MIVVVDDEPDIRALVTAVLEEEGYTVLAFGHPLPAAALDVAQQHPRLFLLDIMLPEMSGITLAGKLGENGFKTVPKVAMSASSRLLEIAGESGLFHATLSKPFDLDELLALVGQLVSEAAPRQDAADQ